MEIYKNNADSICFVCGHAVSGIRIMYGLLSLYQRCFLAGKGGGFVVILVMGDKNETNRDTTEPHCYVLC